MSVNSSTSLIQPGVRIAADRSAGRSRIRRGRPRQLHRGMHLELQILGKERIFKKTFSAFPLASAAILFCQHASAAGDAVE